MEPESELSFVTRAMAGAVSRFHQVRVLVPAREGSPTFDGAFDPIGVGISAVGGWPTPHHAAWPTGLPGHTSVVVDEADETVGALLERFEPGREVRAITSSGALPAAVSLRFLGQGGDDAGGSIGMHVPVNPLAATHRHNGLGFTGYLLVLSDRVGASAIEPPTPMVAWLTARFPTSEIVVVEDASAAVWRGRALRGVVSVDTRTDLWRLLAHARMTVDLAPGTIISRECIESLRFGTPIVVPLHSPAARHAEAGGGMTYGGYGDMLNCVELLSDDALRSSMSRDGQRYADARFGDSAGFVANVRNLLA
jgi:hypothetical protein